MHPQIKVIWKCLCIYCLLFSCHLYAMWTSPDDISAAGQDATQPQIATDPLGNTTAVWKRSNGVVPVIQASTKPIGGSWQAVADTLSNFPLGDDSPQIAIDLFGNATAVWAGSIGPNVVTQASTKPFGGSWQAVPDNLSAIGQDAALPQIAIDADGNATAVWQRSNGANTIIQAATKLFGGSWQAVPDTLSAAGQNATLPQIAVDPDGNATAVWRRFDGANQIIQAATKPFGGSWQAVPDNLSAAGQNAGDPQIAVDDNGNATAIWDRFDGGNFLIQASTKPFGGSWQAVPDTLSVAGATALDPQIAIDPDGNATAIWARFGVIQASTKPFGGSWQVTPDDLTVFGLVATVPQIALDDNGNATAVWQRDDGANERVQAATKPFGGSWSAPDTLSAAGQDATVPQVAVDPNGNATAVWSRSNGVNTIIQASEQFVVPQVLSVSPNEGPPQGGTIVTLTGIGFITAIDVSFGANSASFVINSDSSITATAPSGDLGTVNVIVTALEGSSAASASNQYSYVNPLPPQSLQGEQKTNRFFTQEDIFNVITWSPPTGGQPIVQYRIYHNATLTNLAGIVLASDPLKFEDHNRRKNVTYSYYIVSEDPLGNLSAASSITISPIP